VRAVSVSGEAPRAAITLRTMGPDRETEGTRTKDGGMWRIGRDAGVAWIQQNTERGLAITSAIPPMFEAYATLELPGSGDRDQAS